MSEKPALDPPSQVVRATIEQGSHDAILSPVTREECPDLEKHTVCPVGYLHWHEWAEKKARTHNQSQCPTCGYWAIWKPKKRRAKREAVSPQSERSS